MHKWAKKTGSRFKRRLGRIISWFSLPRGPDARINQSLDKISRLRGIIARQEIGLENARKQGIRQNAPNTARLVELQDVLKKRTTETIELLQGRLNELKHISNPTKKELDAITRYLEALEHLQKLKNTKK